MRTLADEPRIRVMALHALLYCERLFYLEEVEEIRVADDRVYAGRTLHEELLGEGAEQVRTVEIESETLGLIGKTDAIQFRDGSWVPYEHKTGRSMKAKGKAKPEAWPSDKVQVSAYAMLMEEVLGKPVSEGRIRYHADNVTVRIPLDDTARSSVINAVSRARELRTVIDRPPVCPNDRACLKCSLAPVCLPEEDRLAKCQEWEPVRLFPAIPDGKTVHVLTHGAYVRRSGNMLSIEEDGQEKKTCPIQDVRSVVLHGNAQMTTQAIQLCASYEIPVHWLSSGGRYIGGFAPGVTLVQRRVRQYKALCDEDFCLSLVKKLVYAKIEAQLRYLLRSTRGTERTDSMMGAIYAVRNELKSISDSPDIDVIRGREGNAGRAYFGVLQELLSHGVKEEFWFSSRNRRPPQDRFNALLSFGYALLYRSVLESVIAVGLEPALGFYHTPRSAAHPLVMDLMELFRVTVWDISVIGSINRKSWDAQNDFVVTKSKVWLSDTGRRKAIDLFEKRLEECWKHSVTGYSLSYGRTIELEVRLLEKEWTDHPGLFARSRLR